MEHPRWGIIQSVTPNRDIKAGEEIFTFYGYKGSDFPEDFLWYWEAKRLINREERLQSEKRKKKKKQKQKTSKGSDRANSENQPSNETFVITDEISKNIRNVLKCQKSADNIL